MQQSEINISLCCAFLFIFVAMAYIPEIIDLQPFYIQTEADQVARDTTEWGLVPQKNAYPLLPTPKEPYKNEWMDEDGDEEYTEVMHYEPMEISVGFYIKAYDSPAGTAQEQIREQVESFFSLIKHGEFKIYDSYTGLGRQKVRYAGFNEDTFKSRRRQGSNWASATFSLRFKINDPITRVVMYDGSLIAE